MIIQSLVTALSTGLGCGTCCGSGVSAFLFGYLTTHAGSLKHSFRAFLSFYLGKILAVAGVCVACSMLGHQILDENGNIGGVNIHVIVDILMIAMGVWFIIKWIRERLHPGCESCHHCASEPGNSGISHIRARVRVITSWLFPSKTVLTLQTSQGGVAPGDMDGEMVSVSARDIRTEDAKADPEKSGVSYPALIAMGAGYGISPCAPLLMMAGYAATITPAAAFLTGSLFAAASAFVPMLLIMFLTGILSSKLYKEIPQYLGIFRLISYILLIVIFAVTL